MYTELNVIAYAPCRLACASQNSPVYSRSFGGLLETDTLNLQFVTHCSLDVVEEKGALRMSAAAAST